MDNDSTISEEDVIKILLATDIHLGYDEKDQLRGEDSFNAFEEILKTAKDQKVDFVLLGGDLFHYSKPSPSSIVKCTSLLRKYCLGDNPVSVEFVSDQCINFRHCDNPIVNYEDPNQNVSLPVFSIHGNHDDPVGISQLSTLDLFSTMGLINYFGKTSELGSVELEPLRFQKGVTKVEIYGLSHIKDERLVKLIQSSQVSLTTGDPDKWFSILVLHQNRVDRGPKSFFPESALPKFLDFVLWGHEHDCRIDPELSIENDIYICQPGSSVATSLAEGESGKKYIAVMEIYKKSFKLNKIRLRTVRPFVFSDLRFSAYNFDPDSECQIHEQAERMVKFKIEELIEQSKTLLTGHPKQPTLPLIRLRVHYDSEDQLFNTTRTSQFFEERIANPSDVIILNKNFKTKRDTQKADEDIMQEQNRFTRVETVVENYFADPNLPEKKKLNFLSAKSICKAVMSYIDKNDTGAIGEVINYQNQKVLYSLLDVNLDEENIDIKIEEICQKQILEENENEEEINKLLGDPKRLAKRNYVSEEEYENSDEELEMDPKELVSGRSSERGNQGKSTVKTNVIKGKKIQSTSRGVKSKFDQVNLAEQKSDYEDEITIFDSDEELEASRKITICEKDARKGNRGKQVESTISRKKPSTSKAKNLKKTQDITAFMKPIEKKKSTFVVSSDSD